MPGRVRIIDLVSADASSPHYCGHSIGRVLTVEQNGGAQYLHVRRIERSGDHVYGLGEFVSPSEAVKLQTKWDVRWGFLCAPNPAPAKPVPVGPGRTARFIDIDGAAAAIVAAGYREMAKRHHPDAGGSHNAMSLLTQAKSQLTKILGMCAEEKGSAA
jgi:hypothetical protein